MTKGKEKKKGGKRLVGGRKTIISPGKPTKGKKEFGPRIKRDYTQGRRKKEKRKPPNTRTVDRRTHGGKKKTEERKEKN